MIGEILSGGPCGEAQWVMRWKPQGNPDWSAAPSGFAPGTIEVGDLDAGFYEVAAAWSEGGGIPDSPFSNTVVIEVTA
jgi:hypothetical protein